MFGRKLACSFCGRNEADVAKLVAGPRSYAVAGRRVYICDRCVAAARRLMEEPGDVAPISPASNTAPGPASSH